MSYFRGESVQQAVLEDVRGRMAEFDLTPEQMAIVLLKVTSAVIDPFDRQFDEIADKM